MPTGQQTDGPSPTRAEAPSGDHAGTPTAASRQHPAHTTRHPAHRGQAMPTDQHPPTATRQPETRTRPGSATGEQHTTPAHQQPPATARRRAAPTGTSSSATDQQSDEATARPSPTSETAHTSPEEAAPANSPACRRSSPRGCPAEASHPARRATPRAEHRHRTGHVRTAAPRHDGAGSSPSARPAGRPDGRRPDGVALRAAAGQVRDRRPPHWFAVRLVRVLGAQAPVHSLLGHVHGDCYERLVELARLAPLAPAPGGEERQPLLLDARGSQPVDGVIEAFARLDVEGRQRAMAFRLELGRSRKWQCTALELDPALMPD